LKTLNLKTFVKILDVLRQILVFRKKIWNHFENRSQLATKIKALKKLKLKHSIDEDYNRTFLK